MLVDHLKLLRFPVDGHVDEMESGPKPGVGRIEILKPPARHRDVNHPAPLIRRLRVLADGERPLSSSMPDTMRMMMTACQRAKPPAYAGRHSTSGVTVDVLSVVSVST